MRRVIKQVAFVASVMASGMSAFASPPQIVPFTAHGDQIMHVQISDDQKLLLTYSQDSLLKIWQLESRRLIQTFDLKLLNVHEFAIAQSGRLLVGKRPDGTLQPFEFATGHFAPAIATGLGERTKLAITPDGAQVITADESGALRLWDLNGGGLKLAFGTHAVPVQQLAVHPRGDSLIVVYLDGAVWQWDLGTGHAIRSFSVRGDEETRLAVEVAISPDGARLVARTGSVMQIWSTTTGELLRAVDTVPFGPGGLAVSPSGKLIYADACRTSECDWSNDEGRIEVRDIDTGKLVRKLDVGAGKGTSFAFTSDGQKLFHGSVQAAITVWDTASGQRMATFGQASTEARDAAMTPDGSRFVLRLSNGRLQLWNLQTGRKIRALAWTPSAAPCTGSASALAVTNRYVACIGGSSPLPRVWDLESGHFLKTFGAGNEPNDPTRSRLHSAAAVATSDGRYLFSTAEVTANFGETLKVKQPELSQWDLQSGKLVHTFDHANAAVLAVSADGQHMVSGTKAGELRLWAVSSGSLRGAYTPSQKGAVQGNSSFRGVSIADGVVRALFAERLMAFDLSSLALIGEVPAEETHGQLTASRDGRWGAVLGYFSKWKLDLMDLRTGRVIRRFDGLPSSHRVAVGNAVMSPDGKRMVVVGIPTGLGIWDVESGAQLVAAYPSGVEPEAQVGPEALDFDWVSMTPEGFFSAAPRAAELISVVRGLQPYSVEQVWQSLYNPDLLREKLAGDPESEVVQASKVTNLEKVLSSGTPPLATITSHAQRGVAQEEVVTVSATVAEQDAGGIGRIEWRLNGLTAGISDAANHAPMVKASQVLALDPGENTIEVVAYNGRNALASVPARIVLNFGGPSATAKPKLHIFAIAINAYVDRGWTPPGASAPVQFPPLSLAVDDAKALSEALRKGGYDQYADVHVTHVLDADATLEGLEKAINKAAAETHPRDTFVLFVAAHGISEGGRFYLIPQDFQSAPNALTEKAVSQARLQDWIVNRIKAKRALILLDTCESGAVVGGHTRSRTDVPDSEAAIGRLHEATGRPVLTAAAEGKPAFEGFEGHGVFTWTLLDALANGDRNANGSIELSELVAHVQDQVPRISAKLNGRGRAAIAARGSTDDHQSARFGSRGEDFSIVRRSP